MSFRKSKQTIKRPRSSFHRAYRSVQPWLHRQVTSRAPRIPVTTCDSRMLTAVVLLSRGRSTDCEPVNAHSSVRIIHTLSHQQSPQSRKRAFCSKYWDADTPPTAICHISSGSRHRTNAIDVLRTSTNKRIAEEGFART